MGLRHRSHTTACSSTLKKGECAVPGRHRHPPPRWWKPKWLLIPAFIATGWAAVELGPHDHSNGAPPMESLPQAESEAQRLAADVVKLCNISPQDVDTQTCGDAAQVAVTPFRDGKDGKPGRDGIDGLNGADGHNGRNGRDGTNGQDAHMMIIEMPPGYCLPPLGCPRAGGTDLDPVYKCEPAKIVEKPAN